MSVVTSHLKNYVILLATIAPATNLKKKKKQMILYLAIVFRNIPQFFSLAKAVLSLSHGNTSSESRSSIIKSVLDTQRILWERKVLKKKKKSIYQAYKRSPCLKNQFKGYSQKLRWI